MNLSKLHSAIAAVCPIHGVSVGDVNDKNTWVVSFKDEATSEQKAAAQSVINNMDTINLSKAEKLTALETAATVFVKGQYNDEEQKVFLRLQSSGNDTQKALVAQIWAWIDSVLSAYYTRRATVQTATTQSELDAISMDFSEFLLTLPTIGEDSHKVELSDILEAAQ